MTEGLQGTPSRLVPRPWHETRLRSRAGFRRGCCGKSQAGHSSQERIAHLALARFLDSSDCTLPGAAHLQRLLQGTSLNHSAIWARDPLQRKPHQLSVVAIDAVAEVGPAPSAALPDAERWAEDERLNLIRTQEPGESENRGRYD